MHILENMKKNIEFIMIYDDKVNASQEICGLERGPST
jgi:hypothetical protein